MAEVTISIPDDQFARLLSYLDKQGGNLDQFISEAVDERLASEDDPMVQVQVDMQIKQSLAAFDRGEGIDAHQSMREIANDFKIKLKR